MIFSINVLMSYASSFASIVLNPSGLLWPKRRQTLLRLSGLPAIKTLEQFDFRFANGAPRA